MTSGYGVSQSKPEGLTPKQRQEVKKLVRQEVKRALRGTARSPRVTPAPGLAPGRIDLVPVVQGTTTGGGSRLAAHRALDTAERHIEADKSLSKDQRLRALKGIAAAREALGKAPKAGIRYKTITPRILQGGGGRSDLWFDGHKHDFDGVQVESGKRILMLDPKSTLKSITIDPYRAEKKKGQKTERTGKKVHRHDQPKKKTL